MVEYDPGNLETALNRAADPSVSKFVSDTELFWLWEVARQRIVWANPAALIFWGAESILDIAARKQSMSVHGNRQLAQIGKRLGDGNGCLERLRFFRHGREVLLTCKVTAERLNGSRILRVQSIGANQPALNGRDIHDAIVSSIPAAALLIRPDGQIVAANADGDHISASQGEAKTSLGRQIVDLATDEHDHCPTITLAGDTQRFILSTRSIAIDHPDSTINGEPLLLAALSPLADDPDNIDDAPAHADDQRFEVLGDDSGSSDDIAMSAPQNEDLEISEADEPEDATADLNANSEETIADGASDDNIDDHDRGVDAAGLVAAVNDAFGKPAEAPAATPVENIVPFRANDSAASDASSDDSDDPQEDIEKDAFQAIAEALGARLERSQAQARGLSVNAGDDDDETPHQDRDNSSGPMPDQPEMKALLTRLPIAIFVYRGSDARGISEPIFANRALLSLFGYNSIDGIREAGGVAAILPKSDSQEERGRRFGDIAVIGDHVEPIDGGQGKIDGNGDTRDLFIHDSSGVRISVNARLQAIKWDGQNAMMMSILKADRSASGGTSTSIPDRQRRSLNVESILDQVLDAYLILDTNGVVLSLNRGAKALFSVPDTAIIGKPFSQELRAPSDHQADMMFAAIRDKLPGVNIEDGCDVIMRVPGGTDMPYHLKIHPLEKAGNSLFCAIFSDISRWKLVEQEQTDAREQAERDNQQKSTFLAKIGHEIRTPLNSILGFSEAILEEKFGPLENQKYLEYVNNINEGGTHLLSLINDLLDLSKVEAGKMELAFTNVNLNDVVRGTIKLMQSDANKARIIIRSNLALDLADVVADLRSLKQICLNLLSNAIKFTGPGGQVIVASRATQHGEIELRVQDTGTGMNNRELEAALQPFHQLDNQQNDAPGTGLGLPLTKALVEENRARFDIESSKGHGTLVKITFPVNRVLAD